MGRGSWELDAGGKQGLGAADVIPRVLHGAD